MIQNEKSKEKKSVFFFLKLANTVRKMKIYLLSFPISILGLHRMYA